MKSFRIALSVALLVCPTQAWAQSIVTECGGLVRGYQAWAEGGPTDAVERWVEGSGLRGDALIPVLAGVQEMYGRVIGYEVVREVAVSPSLRRIYVAALHEKAPSFGYFDCYRVGGRWTIVNIRINSDKEEILPAEAFWTDVVTRVSGV